MPLNSIKAGKFLLTAGLLAVLVQGLWQLPDLQDYLFPGHQLAADLQSARKECRKIEDDLIALKDRVVYLKWFLAHKGPDQKVSVNWTLSFPFSESIRSTSPNFFWKVNVYLAQKTRVQEERRMRYLDALLKNLDLQLGLPSCPNSTAILPKNAIALNALQQTQALRHQWSACKVKLNKLIEQLTWLESHGYKDKH
jgi:hypothetical protein